MSWEVSILQVRMLRKSQNWNFNPGLLSPETLSFFQNKERFYFTFLAI